MCPTKLTPSGTATPPTPTEVRLLGERQVASDTGLLEERDPVAEEERDDRQSKLVELLSIEERLGHMGAPE